MRGMAVLAVGTLLWGLGAGPAAADSIRDGQWPLKNYNVAKDVWPISQGEGVIVAVVDTGVKADHQDLVGQVLPGADFSGGQSDGRVDTIGHGTSMSGLIAGHGHGTNAGISGLAPKAKILPVRVALSGGAVINNGTSERTPEAIRYAADHGAKVINMSFDGAGDSDMREAIEYAVSKDIVLVASAGNEGDKDRPVGYPAAFPGVVAVGAIDQQGALWAKSNKGTEVTLVAPGADIYAVDFQSTSSYHKSSGTSDASAYVSAIAALVRSKYPNLSAGQVINRMIKSAVVPPSKPALPDDSYGYGIASPREALKPNPAVDNGPKENPLLGRAESHRLGAEGAPSSAAPSKPAAGGNSAAPGGGSTAGSDDSSGIPLYVLVIAGVLAVVVIGGIVVLVMRSRGNGGGGGDNGGPGGGTHLPPTAPPPYGPSSQQFPPQAQAPYGGGQPQPQPYGAPQPYPSQHAQPYQPQQQQQQPPAGGGGSPYR